MKTIQTFIYSCNVKYENYTLSNRKALSNYFKWQINITNNYTLQIFNLKKIHDVSRNVLK